MTARILFALTRPAKSKGGDRYETPMPNGEMWSVYIPQSISRPSNNQPILAFEMILNAVEEKGGTSANT